MGGKPRANRSVFGPAIRLRRRRFERRLKGVGKVAGLSPGDSTHANIGSSEMNR